MLADRVAYWDHLHQLQPRCPGCLAPIPFGRVRWCSTRCATFVRRHPGDFLRLFRWCRACGVEIDHLGLAAKFCSFSCASRSKVAAHASLRRCQACGLAFQARRGRGGAVAKTCSRSCYYWASRHPGQTRSVARCCRQCGTDISHRSGPTKYCSQRCSEIARGQRLPEPLAQRRCALLECGATFQPHSSRQRCCCEKHGKLLYNRESRADGRQKPPPWSDVRRDRYHRRRAQKKAASTGEPVLLAAIAERDGWQCSLCQQLVDPAVAWPDSLSPSLDHRVPLSKGGAHDPSNVYLAHLGCNSSKGDRLLDDGSLLTG